METARPARGLDSLVEEDTRVYYIMVHSLFFYLFV